MLRQLLRRDLEPLAHDPLQLVVGHVSGSIDVQLSKEVSPTVRILAHLVPVVTDPLGELVRHIQKLGPRKDIDARACQLLADLFGRLHVNLSGIELGELVELAVGRTIGNHRITLDVICGARLPGGRCRLPLARLSFDGRH